MRTKDPKRPPKEMLESLISRSISEVRSKIVELKTGGKDFSATTLIEKIHNKSCPITIDAIFKEEITELRNTGRGGYADSMTQVYNSLIKFNRHLDLHFSEVDVLWLKRYEAWLRKQGLAENTIGIRFRIFRRIFNIALDRKVVRQEDYPFKAFGVARLHQETPKRAIKKNDVYKIFSYPTERKGYYHSLAIDLFKFSYFMGGINFADMAYLTTKNIIDNQLIYYRKKTKKLIVCHCSRKTGDTRS
ncbi:MAG: phage integrase SAM-like domain-containing protein [Clostridium sp.]|nr:phage integrase SAM-like domain-containing protein [Clostridium sp.]